MKTQERGPAVIRLEAGETEPAIDLVGQRAAAAVQTVRRPERRCPEPELGDGRILVLDGDPLPVDEWPVFAIG